jgi:hypothetical protein
MRTAEIFGLVLAIYYVLAGVVAHGFLWLERRVVRFRGMAPAR